MFRRPRALDPTELRLLGCLLEKDLATPDLYPLTLNSLAAACNQKTNREPVTSLSADEVRDALDRMLPDVLVWKIEGGRTLKWKHSLDRRWRLEPNSKAVMALLMLRGPQTPGELRGRSDRLAPFASIAAVEETLERLSSGVQPLVAELPRQPGQKGNRWGHCLGDPAAVAAASTTLPVAEPDAKPAAHSADDGRIEQLEQRVAHLEQLVSELRSELGLEEPGSVPGSR